MAYEETTPVPPPVNPDTVTSVGHIRMGNFTLPIDPFSPLTQQHLPQQVETYFGTNLRKKV